MKISRRKFMAVSGFSLLPGLGPAARFRSPLQRPATPSTSNESWIELNLEHLTWNLERIKTRVKVPIMAVIKANAYGHGLLDIGNHLDNCNIDAVMVCKLQEAIDLKKSGVTCPVFNFGPLFPQSCEDIVRYDIGQFLSSSGYEHLIEAARKQNKRVKIHVHIDTGMNRMGIPFAEAPSYLKKLQSYPELEIQGISTTLTEEEAFEMEQRDRLLTASSLLERTGSRSVKRHAASSAGIFSARSLYLDMIRPGIALYGYYPNQQSARENSLQLKPVLQFKTRIAETRSLKQGDSASYHRLYKAKKQEKIAVLPVGYSDGIPPRIVNKGVVLVRGQKCPIIASITANHTVVRLPSDMAASPGEEVVLLGSQGNQTVSADDYAAWAETSNYKILIGLNPLLPRRSLAP